MKEPPKVKPAVVIPPHKQKALEALAEAIAEMGLFEKAVPTFGHEARGIVRRVEEIVQRMKSLPVG